MSAAMGADNLFMRILIQNLENGKYLAGVRKSVASVYNAKDFVSPALAYAIGNKIVAGRFRVILHSPESGGLIDFMAGAGQPKHRATD